jgi:hypothetical protein
MGLQDLYYPTLALCIDALLIEVNRASFIEHLDLHP